MGKFRRTAELVTRRQEMVFSAGTMGRRWSHVEQCQMGLGKAAHEKRQCTWAKSFERTLEKRPNCDVQATDKAMTKVQRGPEKRRCEKAAPRRRDPDDPWQPTENEETFPSSRTPSPNVAWPKRRRRSA